MARPEIRYDFVTKRWQLSSDDGVHIPIDVAQGSAKVIQVAVTSDDMGTDVDSETSIPDGASILRVSIQVETVFSGGSNPAVAVSVNGGTPLTLTVPADSNIESASQFFVEGAWEITSANEGTIRCSLSGTATAGSALVCVEYIELPLS